jgi:uncharacterized protein (DUF362 family)
MKTRLHSVLDQLVKRCPRSGRWIALRRDTPLARVFYPFLGCLAIAWYLFRVVPKPSRADYPCQKVAAGVGIGFVTWLVGCLLALQGANLVRRRVGRVAAALCGLTVAAFVYASVGTGGTADAEKPVVQNLNPVEGRNRPMGIGKGIGPGRVVWAQDFEATKWDGKTGAWWEEQNTDLATVEKMFSASLQRLTETQSDPAAWEKLFRYFNRTSGRGDRGYQKGEELVIKLNCNADSKGEPWTDRGYPNPQVVYVMVRQLIEVAGVPGECITLADPSRCLNDILYNRVRINPRGDYQQVSFADNRGGSASRRLKAEPDMNCPIHFELPGNVRTTMYLPKVYTEAAYLINYALLRPHRVFGITVAAKNHFGSVYDPTKKAFAPNVLHAFALWDYPTPYRHGQPNGLVQLLGHKELGGKTLLYFADGLYTSKNQSLPVVRWSTLNNRWCSSLLLSQDPVALDSVAYDLIGTEPNLTAGNPSFNGNVDGYLHEAALADTPPSNTRYDPMGDGTSLKSLGVHEHWNNADQKSYSRNQGKREGIELVRLSYNRS